MTDLTPWADALSPAAATGAEDLHSRLLEAGATGCCAEGDLLALMPSVNRAADAWVDGESWLHRLLGV